MYDIKPLEAEWKKYKRKKLRPWYISSLIFIVLSVFAIIFLTNKNIDFSILDKYTKTSKDILSFEEKSKDILPLEEKNAENIVLVDGGLNMLEVKENMLDVVDTVVKKPLNLLVDIPILDDTKEPISEEIPEVKKRVHLKIIESTSVTAYKDVEKRFLESHDIDDSLFLAKSYYKKGNYKKAEYWALQTNKLDENIEESLLIFVKSKMKQGSKNEAIAILTDYVKKSNSQEAKNLLYRIKNDKL